MIFIDPSELRETSNLVRFIPDMVYKILPDLEAITGADVMISPDGLPPPNSDVLLQMHIDCGCKLIQLKFGHDLPGSVVDGRLNEALSRMLKAGANSWQCLLLFIGLLGYEDTREMATINGQLTYGDFPMKWKAIDSKLMYWVESGGSLDFPLPSGKLIPKRFMMHQKHLNLFRSGKNERVLWPKAPVFYDEIKPTNPYLRKWKVARKLVAREDIAPLICAIPGVRIGEKKAMAIFDYMEENDIRQDLNGFLEIVNDESILNVPGIGKKLLEDINRGLFMTLEERNK